MVGDLVVVVVGGGGGMGKGRGCLLVLLVEPGSPLLLGLLRVWRMCSRVWVRLWLRM